MSRVWFRLPWRAALRRVQLRRILELALVVAALRLLLLSAVARKEAIPHVRGGFPWDERLAAADRWLHSGVTPDYYLRWLTDSPVLLRAMDLFYLEGFWIGCTAVLLWWGWSPHPERGRFFTAFALVWLLLGAVVATIFASAGSCLPSRRGRSAVLAPDGGAAPAATCRHGDAGAVVAELPG